MKMKLGLIAMWGFVLGQELTLIRVVKRFDTVDTAVPLSILAIIMIVINIRNVMRSAVKSVDVTKH